jgi:Ca2+-binding RTX toxin-like protein
VRLSLDTLTSIESATGSAHDDIVVSSSAANIIDGGGGTDTIYGGSGAATFMFKAAMALSASVTLEDFSKSAGDKIDISDVLAGHYDPLQDATNNFVQTAVSGSDTVIKVDVDGTGSAHAWQQVATIVGITGLTTSDLIHDGNLIVMRVRRGRRRRDNFFGSYRTAGDPAVLIQSDNNTYLKR